MNVTLKQTKKYDPIEKYVINYSPVIISEHAKKKICVPQRSTEPISKKCDALRNKVSL